jgi:predicted PurR-regulated permease PerM
MVNKIEISHKTILFTFGLILLCWFLVKISSILLLLFVALLLSITISPLVDRIQKAHVPRIMAILIVYVLLVGTISLVLSIIIPALIDQTTQLTENLSAPIQNLPFLQINWSTILGQMEAITRNVVGLARFIISAAGNALTLFALLVFTFYFTYEKQHLDSYLDRWLDGAYRTRVSRIVERLDLVLGGWLRGQLLLMLIIGIMSYIGLLILGIDYALPLALLAGLLEFVPNLGPTLAAVPAFFAGWSISTLTGIGVLLLYIIIQQLENYIIVPQVMKRATGLHPLVSLVGLLIGGKLYGFVGILLAIPVFLVLRVIFEEVFREKLNSR